MIDRKNLNEAYVYFGLFGDFDSREVTKRIGIEPTSSCNQGSRDPIRNLPRTAQWEISTEKVVAEAIDIYELAESVVNQLKPKKEELKKTIQGLKLKAVLQTVICFSTDDAVSTPAIGFSNDVVAFLAEIGASIDIDTCISPN